MESNRIKATMKLCEFYHNSGGTLNLLNLLISDVNTVLGVTISSLTALNNTVENFVDGVLDEFSTADQLQVLNVLLYKPY